MTKRSPVGGRQVCRPWGKLKTESDLDYKLKKKKNASGVVSAGRTSFSIVVVSQSVLKNNPPKKSSRRRRVVVVLKAAFKASHFLSCCLERKRENKQNAVRKKIPHAGAMSPAAFSEFISACLKSGRLRRGRVFFFFSLGLAGGEKTKKEKKTHTGEKVRQTGCRRQTRVLNEVGRWGGGSFPSRYRSAGLGTCQ